MKVISYEKIGKSEGVDFKVENSVKYMICGCWCFKDIGFKYQPYVCDNCHDFSMTVMNLSDFFIVNIKKVDYRIYISGIEKKQLFSF